MLDFTLLNRFRNDESRAILGTVEAAARVDRLNRNATHQFCHFWPTLTVECLLSALDSRVIISAHARAMLRFSKTIPRSGSSDTSATSTALARKYDLDKPKKEVE